MSNDSLISVIIPVYNVEQYLRRCIDSVINQTYTNLQIILIDNGSSDDSGKICEAYAKLDNRIEVVHQENKGVSYARNTGLKLRKGDYFVFLDSDDSIESCTFSSVMDCFNTAKADVVFYGVRKIYSTGKQEYVVNNPGKYPNDVVIKGILSDYTSFGAGFPVNKVWHIPRGNEVPLFDDDLYFFEDMEWVVRMLLQIDKAEILDEYFYNYYIRDDSTTRKTGKEASRELGYHKSAIKIREALLKYPVLHEWFSAKYFPELVNGVLDALLKKRTVLSKELAKETLTYHKEILRDTQIPIKIKFRCMLITIASKLKIL